MIKPKEKLQILNWRQVGISTILEPTNLISAQMKGHGVTMDIKQNGVNSTLSSQMVYATPGVLCLVLARLVQKGC